MDELDTIPKSKTGLIVVIVLVGVAILGLGLFLAYKKNGAGDESTGLPGEAARWCKLRQEWAQAVRPLSGEIMVTGVKADGEEELRALVVKRNTFCNDQAKALRDLLTANPKVWTLVQKVEELLIKEGKVRSNVMVEIGNSRSNMTAGTTEELIKHKNNFKEKMKERIEGTEAKLDEEFKAVMAELKAKGLECHGLYRGPMTDAGTSGNPYASWEELKLKRTVALKEFDQAVVALQPMEDYSRLVREKLMGRHKALLKKCFDQAKKKNPEMSDKLGLRVRVDRKGKVATLAIEWMANRDEQILDCLLDNAADWTLPKPEEGVEYAVVSLDFSAM